MENSILVGLDPIVYGDSRLLILGSMPGRQSLAMGRYYDYGQNRFWKIIFAYMREQCTDDYETKKDVLRRAGIALWDAVLTCERTGSSLDSRIKNATGSDISGFLKRHPSIKNVITNGRAAEKYLVKFNPDVKYTYLPSTSPANASVKNVEEIWLDALARLL